MDYVTENNFRDEGKIYFIEVELNSSGDIKEKLYKYEALFWRLTKSLPCPYTLGIIYDRKPHDGANISSESNIDFKSYDLGNLSAEWQW